jgi:hypothetical protein
MLPVEYDVKNGSVLKEDRWKACKVKTTAINCAFRIAWHATQISQTRPRVVAVPNYPTDETIVLSRIRDRSFFSHITQSPVVASSHSRSASTADRRSINAVGIASRAKGPLLCVLENMKNLSFETMDHRIFRKTRPTLEMLAQHSTSRTDRLPTSSEGRSGLS